MYVLTPSSCPGVVVVEELSVWLLMGPTCFQCARARLAPARARSVASRPFSHSKSHPDRSLFCLHPAPSAQPPRVLSYPSHPTLFLPLLAPLGPRNKHTTTQGATPSARSLRGRHNRRRKLPFPRALRPTVWHRVSSSPDTQGHL
jgi:hypothetical protein